MGRNDFEETYRTNVQRIFRYCLYRTNSRQDAEDMTAEVFTRFLTARGSVRGSRITPWLYTVAHNLCADAHVRAQRRAHVVLGEDVAGSEDPAWCDPTVWEAMRTLSPNQQQVLFLKAVEGYTFGEIAELTGRSASAVKMSYYRGAEALAAKIGDNC